MELEQRVQELEQELQILKGQIQMTLLEIQEQLLINAYPSLRADNNSSTRSSTPGPQTDVDHSHRVPQQQNIRRVSLDDLNVSEEADPPAPQTVVAVRKAASETDWDRLAELEEWAGHKVEQMGVERTQELIRVYSDKGRFSAEVGEALIQFISVFDHDARPARVQTAQPPAPAQTRPREPESRSAQKPRKVAAAPQNGRSKSTARQAPSSQAKARPRPAAQKVSQSAVRQQEDPAEQPAASSKRAGGDEAEAPQRLVLKLIAGVQNAGMRWTKNYG